MKISRNGLFSPPRILTFAKIFVLSMLAIMLAGSLTLATTYTDNSMPSGNISTTTDNPVEFNISGSATFSNTISGAGTVTKTGPGTLTLSNKNLYTGNTTVNDGTLKLTFVANSSTDRIGTLRQGTSVTVDGSNSCLDVSTGNVLGYKYGSVGTLNLQNGGKLYGGHEHAPTLDAIINMNNGIIYSDSTATATTGNFIFDNIVNVTGGTDNEISAYKISLRSQDNGPYSYPDAGKFNVAEGAKLTISSVINHITETGDVKEASLQKLGDGDLVLTGANEYAAGTTISAGNLILTGAGTLGTGVVTLETDADTNKFGTLEFNNSTASISSNITGAGDILVSAGTATLTGSVTQTGGATTLAEGATLSINNDATLYNLSGGSIDANGQMIPTTLEVTGDLTLNNTELTKFIGSITAPAVEKTGDGTLQLCFDAQGGVDIQSLTVSSGHVDIKGYMTGQITVNADGEFSPGNSVGEATFGEGFILNEGAKLLMEVDGTGADILTCDTFTMNGGKAVLDWQNDEIPFLATCDIIVSESSDLTNVYNNIVLDFSTSPTVARLFNDGYITISLADDNKNIIRLSIDRNAVPEPSTWALLVLGVVGLMYWRKNAQKRA